MPKPEQDAITTSPQTPITLTQLRDAIFDRLEESKQATVDHLKRLEATLLEKWMAHEKRLDEHDKDIGQLRGGRFPQSPLWALVVVTALMWLTVVVFASLILFYVTHAAAFVPR